MFNIKNKKAITGTTITWIIGIFALTAGSLVFLVSLLTLSAHKITSSGSSQILINSDRFSSNIEIENSIISFLNKKATLENSDLTFSEIIKRSSLENEKEGQLFKSEAEKVFNNILSSTNTANPPWWLRVYKTNDLPQKSLTEKRTLISGGTSCDPADLINSVLISHFIAEKRVILCIDKAYYEYWKNTKFK